ncbi:MAG: lipid-binding SYLF domain-containing protein [Acidobacteriota bacterium]|nr:lipid-binding SYLF domain-containing protein [Acidobacteriota bacterium]
MRNSMMVMLAAASLTPSLFAKKEDVDKRLAAASTVMSEIMNTPDKGIPDELLDSAECVIIVPSLKKGAFVFGGKYGKGFTFCRHATGAGWSAPAGVIVEGGSFGFQIGGSETDVVMLVMNKTGADHLMSSQFTLGGDASIAAGPVGRTAAADTDATMRAQILSYSRARGIFAGVALSGATLREDKDTNREMYGSVMTNKEILRGTTKAPAAGAGIETLLNKYSRHKEPTKLP